MGRNNRAIGAQKERLAKWYLETLGYEILEMNYRCRQGEIDIIGKDEECLVFVEVKYRADLRMGEPALAVNYYKQKKISQVARHYLYSKHYREDYPCRFDVVEIVGKKIRVIKDCFSYIG